MRKKISLNIHVDVLKKIDKTRGMIPRSRWIEDVCKRAITSAAPRPNKDIHLPIGVLDDLVRLRNEYGRKIKRHEKSP